MNYSLMLPQVFESHFVANPLNEPPLAAHTSGDKRSSQKPNCKQQAPRAMLEKKVFFKKLFYFLKTTKLTAFILSTITTQRPRCIAINIQTFFFRDVFHTTIVGVFRTA